MIWKFIGFLLYVCNEYQKGRKEGLPTKKAAGEVGEAILGVGLAVLVVLIIAFLLY